MKGEDKSMTEASNYNALPVAEPLLEVNGNTENSASSSSSSWLYSLLWLALLIWIAWPVAFFALSLWIALQPFEALLDVLQIVNRLLEQVVTWPRACGKAIATGDTSLPQLFDTTRAQEAADVQNELDWELPTADSHCGRLLCSLLWVVLLVYVAWPIAGLVGGLWVFLQPLEAVVFRDDHHSTNSNNNNNHAHHPLMSLQKLATWPRACGHAIAMGQSTVPFPPSMASRG